MDSLIQSISTLIRSTVVVPAVVMSLVVRFTFLIGFVWHVSHSNPDWVTMDTRLGLPILALKMCTETNQKRLLAENSRSTRLTRKSTPMIAPISEPSSIVEVDTLLCNKQIQYNTVEAHLQSITNFQTQCLHKSKPAMDKIVVNWLDKLRIDISLITGSNKAQNLAARVQHLTIDLVTKIHLGFAAGCTATGSDVYQLLDDLNQRATSSSMLGSFSHCIRRYTSAATESLGFSSKVHFSRLTGLQRLDSVIDMILNDSSEATESPALVKFLADQGMSSERIKTVVISSIASAISVIPTAVNATVAVIMADPASYSRLTAEIRTTRPDCIVSYPIQDYEIGQFPTLYSCICDGLRKYQRSGQLCGVSMDFSNWGSAPAYEPEGSSPTASQWMLAGDEELRSIYKTHNLKLVGSSTDGLDLGQQLTTSIISQIVFEILRNFDIATTGSAPFEITPRHSGALSYHQKMNVRLTPVADLPAYEHSMSDEAPPPAYE